MPRRERFEVVDKQVWSKESQAEGAFGDNLGRVYAGEVNIGTLQTASSRLDSVIDPNTGEIVHTTEIRIKDDLQFTEEQQPLVDSFVDAIQRLDETCGQKAGRKNNRDIRRRKAEHGEFFDEHSVLTLPPDRYSGKNAALDSVQRVLPEEGINTKKQLVDVDVDELHDVKGIGRRGIEVLEMMQKAAEADLAMRDVLEPDSYREVVLRLSERDLNPPIPEVKEEVDENSQASEIPSHPGEAYRGDEPTVRWDMAEEAQRAREEEKEQRNRSRRVELPDSWDARLLQSYLTEISLDPDKMPGKNDLPQQIQFSDLWQVQLLRLSENGVARPVRKPIVLHEDSREIRFAEETIEYNPQLNFLLPDYNIPYDDWRARGEWAPGEGEIEVGNIYSPGVNSLTEQFTHAKPRFTTSAVERFMAGNGGLVLMNVCNYGPGEPTVQMAMKSTSTPILSEEELAEIGSYSEAVKIAKGFFVSRAVNRRVDVNRLMAESLGWTYYVGNISEGVKKVD